MTHDQLLDYVRETIITREKQGLPTDAESIIQQMVNELDNVWAEAITKAVHEFLAQ